MTDWYVDEIFDFGFDCMVNQYSRLVFDPERFRDDNKEDLAKKGMGAIYTRTSHGKVLREMSKTKELITKYYDPYHQEFSRAVTDKLKAFGRCLIVDAHSFPSAPLPYEINQEYSRPDICLGADPYHTQTALLNLARECFLKQKVSVEINQPFSGAIVPEPFFRTDKRVSSIMVELNRSLYMDEKTRELTGFAWIKRMVLRLLSRMARYCL